MANEQEPLEHSNGANGNAADGHDQQRNGKDRDGPRKRKPAWRNIIENLSGAWFTIPMSTGASRLQELHEADRKYLMTRSSNAIGRRTWYPIS